MIAAQKSMALRWFSLMLTGLGSLAGLGQTACAETPAPRVLTRVVFQDDEARALRWADVLAGTPPTLGPVHSVAGFPTLDPERQTLVQMEAAKGFVLVGVRDDDDGQHQSGWVLIETGVAEDDHGDHSHWTYPREPRVRAAVLDDKQGNPAHLYCYDDVFYLANDRLNGYTRVDPAAVQANDDAAAVARRAAFFQGGGRHITLAVSGGTVGYGTWTDREGPDKGRVDITEINATGNRQIACTFHLPHGGLHGATACQGKIFLAPSEGVTWFSTPNIAPVDPKSLALHQWSLGKEGDKPVRTGAFTTSGKHVAFVTGGGPTAAVHLVDASAVEPVPVKLSVPMAAGNRPSGLEIIRTRKGSPLAFVFHDHAADVEAPHRLSLIELDPNLDGAWGDARVTKELDVGKSRVEGHGGHHSVAFDADRRRAVFSNPGSATLTLFALEDRQPLADWSVGGIPSKVILVGGRASHD